MWVIVKVPTPLGVARGVAGEIIDEVPDHIQAAAICHATWVEDIDPDKTLHYNIVALEILDAEETQG